MLNIIAIKAASLDPFGIGLEMEAEKPGWCDALNGLPGLLGSSVNEAFELRRWAAFLLDHLPELLAPGEKHPVAEETADLLKAVKEALALAHHDDFFKTWDTLRFLARTLPRENADGRFRRRKNAFARRHRAVFESLERGARLGSREPLRPTVSARPITSMKC